MKDRTPRSTAYQHKILELHVDQKFFDLRNNDEGLYDSRSDENKTNLKEELRLEIRRLIGSYCTPTQKKVYELICDGYNQTETGKIMNMQQTSVTKCLHGNVNYKNNTKYGGIIKKMRKLIEGPEGEKIRRLLLELDDLEP